MIRLIAGVVVGYLILAGLLFVSFTAAYAVLGADRAFQPGTYQVSTLWVAAGVAIWLGAGLAGGYVCARLARRRTAADALAGIVLVLGVLVAGIGIIGAQGGESGVRSGEVGNADAMKSAQTPPWAALLNPLVGAAGIMAGSRRRDLPAA
jgi:type IV secretory pathway TrbL component